VLPGIGHGQAAHAPYNPAPFRGALQLTLMSMDVVLSEARTPLLFFGTAFHNGAHPRTLCGESFSLDSRAWPVVVTLTFGVNHER